MDARDTAFRLASCSPDRSEMSDRCPGDMAGMETVLCTLLGSWTGSRLLFLPFCPLESPDVLESAEYGLLLLAPRPPFGSVSETSTNKLFTSLERGVPNL